MRNFEGDRWNPPRECEYLLKNGKECGVPLQPWEERYCELHQKIVDRVKLRKFKETVDE